MKSAHPVAFIRPEAVEMIFHLLRGDRIGWRTALVGIAFATFADGKGICWPARRTVAERLGIHPSNVSNAIRELKAAGFFRVQYCRGSSSIYRLNHFPKKVIPKTGKPPLPETSKGVLPKTGKEKEPEKEPKKKPASGAVAWAPEVAVKTNGSNVWATWVDLNQAAGRRDPVREGADLAAAKRIAAAVNRGDFPAGDLPGLLAAYLALPDNFLAQQGHALRNFSSRINYLLNDNTGSRDPEAERIEREQDEAARRYKEKHCGPGGLEERIAEEAAGNGRGKDGPP